MFDINRSARSPWRIRLVLYGGDWILRCALLDVTLLAPRVLR